MSNTPSDSAASSESTSIPQPSGGRGGDLVLPPGSALLRQLPGLDNPDATGLVGRSRLSQALELEEKPDGRYLRMVLYGLGAAFLIFIPWAALTPINEVVVASGEVVPEGNVNTIQHLEGGIVERIAVQEGDQVKKGDLIMQLRPNLVDSEYKAARQKLQALTLQQAQLQAAIRGDNVLPPSIKELGALGNKVHTAQLNLLNSRLDNTQDQIATVQAQIDQKRAEIARFNDQEVKFLREQDLLRQGVSMYEKLDNQGAVSRLQVVNAQRELAASNTRLAELRGNRSVSYKLLSEAQAKLRSLRSGLRLEDNSKIASLTNEEAVVAEDIRKVRNRLERTSILAPVSGLVQDVRYKNESAVVGPGAVIASVVPDGTPRLVEARVRPADIGFVKLGQKAEIKLQPYDYSIYGAVSGQVIAISPTTFQNPDDRQYYYRVKIALEDQFVDAKNRRYPILPGMTLTADIQGPKRSVLRYLFQPLTRTMNSAFRESR
ncbi:HlyD family type I secretion periplasmic adaptor subunit [Vulcanococcus limneticus]|uniref:HlyD family type I secretion periplasmic adaptor subunit n=1 Tax=Vulcanococcus limneticus TaxID=2170428 RepID=UPI000B996799|nr:HlyD family type I secretion periplasmic adaptor subunit [Vulcanococcus limneticus]MCP9793060.1 HlyD family type I secretion periplasmic adaptor subunit [Vulcanococcus limneticus MW73D5]MCP9895023.1 HlyD family type I secretion periplasmic adaptor subunit [Vulcanococcus limneticus Candia 3F8]MCP9898477.1 HlyD family type I secretion periplasmic adaptor subunit [Vulcanococcus limneticus Candia 3B3]